MENLSLSLRHRKLIYFLQNQNTYITGEVLGTYFHVSARTIRNDVTEINSILSNTGIRIKSKRSCGYIIEADDKEKLKLLTKASSSFLSRDERIRHIALNLCYSETPLNLLDLEDEMYISRTTLEHDIIEMRKKYILPYPHIKLIRHKNSISLENNERKKRALLNHLYSENWNYNSRGNSYYNYQYMDEEVVNLIMKLTNKYIVDNHILIEDINMVILNLSLTIMYYRIIEGHHLNEPIEITYNDPLCVVVADKLMNELEEKLDFTISSFERSDIYLLLSCSRMYDAKKLNFETVTTFFSKDILDLVDNYINDIKSKFLFDFSDNEDFYITILQYFCYLSLPIHNLNVMQTHWTVPRSNLIIEYEIAYAFQPIAYEYFGQFLDYNELLYLAFCISGALSSTNDNSPKLNTVVMCHLNLPATWNLKHKILHTYGNTINITALLPLYSKDNFDFSNTDLIICTANKKITNEPNCHTIIVSPFLDEENRSEIDTYIKRMQINRLFNNSAPFLYELFEDAYWHEQIESDNYLDVLELLATDFLNEGITSHKYLCELLRRESILSFVFQPGFVLTYSLEHSTKTRLSIATLKHRLRWNSYKVHTIIMATFKEEDFPLLFRLISDIYFNNFSIDDLSFERTKKGLTEFFIKHTPKF